jgi:hypothetical protein
MGSENKGKRSQIVDDDILMRSTCYFLCINLEEWMADSGVALQGNGHRQVDGTYSETYKKLSSKMPYKINDGIPYLIKRLQMLSLLFVKLTIKFKTKNTLQIRTNFLFGTKQ